MKNIITIALTLSMLCACGGASRPNSSVWDTYDIRYPVPAGSSVPVSRATIYDTYTDNDATYKPPRSTNFDLCSSASISNGTCN